MSAPSPVVNIMIQAAEKAARGLLRDFGEIEKLQVTQKSHGDFVSKADMRSEQTLHRELADARPDYGFIMEESGDKYKGDSDFTFIIDPLDGTSNFLYGIPHWCISIALMEKDEVIAGVIYDPVKQEMFRAEKGRGAFVNNYRLKVSGRKNFSLGSVCTGWAHGGDDFGVFIEENTKLQREVKMVRRLGAGALDLAYTAAGRFDVFYERGIKIWDIAAGSLMVKEAKGVITDLKLGTDYLETGNVVAGSPFMHKKLAEFLNFG